jgi:23S rRNA (adenine2503-C2)-methyltransferase
LSNFENFRASLDIIMNEDAFNIGGRKITVSTAGVIPSIEKLIAEDLNVGLAISLNSYNNEQRDTLMPINKKYPIEQLVSIAKKYFEKTGRRVTFEYVVIDGETNTSRAASALKKLLGGFPCKINIIPVNPSQDSSIRTPDNNSVERFSDELNKLGLSATVRKSRGRDISGACGQLAGNLMEDRQSTTDLSIRN